LDLDSKPAHVFVRGEYTKTRADRIVFLTDEVTQQLKSWLSYKYRKRRVCHNKDGSTITEYRTPPKEETDLVFAVYQTKRMPNPDGIYGTARKRL
jgi:integrase